MTPIIGPGHRVMVPTHGVEIITTRGGVTADWWDPNDAGLCVVAAYRAINTPGNPWPNDAPGVYADTLVNNANPGVNNLVEGNGAVPWAANTGWQFNAAALQYYDTGYLPNDPHSGLAQYNGTTNAGAVFGSFVAGGPRRFYVIPNQGGLNRVQYAYGNTNVVAPQLLTGNLGIAGGSTYRNGALEGFLLVWGGGASPISVYIGCYNQFGAVNFITANIESVAFYNCTLTGPQVLAVVTAMAQL